MNTDFLRRRSTWVGAAVLIAVAGASLWGLNRSARAADSKPVPATAAAVQATTALVQQQDVPIYRSGIGTVTAAASVTVKARIDGQLDQVGFSEGQDVKAGQVLARIDPRTLQAQLAQVQAQKARDQAQLANARVDLQRFTTLIAEDAATTQQLDTQKALVAQLEAAVQTDEAQINFAQVQLGFTTIAAPISGRVGARLVDPGNIVHAADAGGLVVINQIDPISVVFTLPEDNLQPILKQLHAGATLAVTAFDRSQTTQIAAGTLGSIDNQMNTSTGTFRLRAEFPNADESLFPNQFVNIQLLADTQRDVPVIPTAAVQRGAPGTFVFVVGTDDTVSVRPVKLGTSQGERVSVASGLEPGERVVVDGADKLRDGAKINVRTEAANPTAPAAGGGAAPGPGPEKAGKKRRSDGGQKQDNEQKQDGGQKQ